jgi:replicative DNA helicase
MLRVSEYDAVVETDLIGGLLFSQGQGADEAMPLAPSDFLDPRVKVVFAAFLDLWQDGKPCGTFEVLQLLEERGELQAAGGMEFVGALATHWPAKSRLKTWAETIRDHAATRRLLQALAEAQDVVMQDGPLEAKIGRVQALIAPAVEIKASKRLRSLREAVIAQTEHYERLARGEVEAGWATGIGGLDRLLSGGLRPGRMVVLAARPAVGKSSLAQFIATNVTNNGRKALILSQEMAVEDLANRAVASRGRVQMGHLVENGPTDDEWSRIIEAADDRALESVYVDDQPALRMSDIRAKCRAVKGLSLVVVDYLQLMSGSSEQAARSQNRENEIAQISRGLKALAMELGVCVIALSQLNRQVEQRTDKRPNLSDLRESGAIEQDADVVGLLWLVREFGDGGKLVGLTLAKNRIGRTGDVALHFEGGFQHWAESTVSLHQPAAAKKTGGLRD